MAQVNMMGYVLQKCTESGVPKVDFAIETGMDPESNK